MDFRIIKLNGGGYIPEVKSESGFWRCIHKLNIACVFMGNDRYLTFYGIDYAVDRCQVSSEEKAEKIINDYYDWLMIKEQKERFVVVKEITKG